MPKVRLKEKKQESGGTGHLLTGVSYRRLCEIFFPLPLPNELAQVLVLNWGLRESGNP